MHSVNTPKWSDFSFGAEVQKTGIRHQWRRNQTCSLTLIAKVVDQPLVDPSSFSDWYSRRGDPPRPSTGSLFSSAGVCLLSGPVNSLFLETTGVHPTRAGAIHGKRPYLIRRTESLISWGP